MVLCHYGRLIHYNSLILPGKHSFLPLLRKDFIAETTLTRPSFSRQCFVRNCFAWHRQDLWLSQAVGALKLSVFCKAASKQHCILNGMSEYWRQLSDLPQTLHVHRKSRKTFQLYNWAKDKPRTSRAAVRGKCCLSQAQKGGGGAGGREKEETFLTDVRVNTWSQAS